MSDLLIRHATIDDLETINRIYNAEIEGGVATWDMDPWPLERRRAWFDEHGEDQPVLVAEHDGAVIGFGYLSLYRERAGYRFTREDTLYVEPSHQRRGVGRALLAALIEEARRCDIHCLIARIESSNEGSIELHRRFGFEIAGREREIGRKFDRWLDLVTMQLLIDREQAPQPR